MTQRGYVRVRAQDGSTPYEELPLNSEETWRFPLIKNVDGVDVDLDISAANLTARLRISKIGSATVPVDELATEVGVVTVGKGFVVEFVFAASSNDFAAGDSCEATVSIVDTDRADATTESAKVETVWLGIWLVTMKKPLNAA